MLVVCPDIGKTTVWEVLPGFRYVLYKFGISERLVKYVICSVLLLIWYLKTKTKTKL